MWGRSRLRMCFSRATFGTVDWVGCRERQGPFSIRVGYFYYKNRSLTGGLLSHFLAELIVKCDAFHSASAANGCMGVACCAVLVHIAASAFDLYACPLLLDGGGQWWGAEGDTAAKICFIFPIHSNVCHSSCNSMRRT